MGMEEAVHRLADVPARLFGLKQRGRIAGGWHADLVLFDPARIAPATRSCARTCPAVPAACMSAQRASTMCWSTVAKWCAGMRSPARCPGG